MNNCPICDKPLEGKQQYCSAACRKTASRQSKEEPELPKSSGDASPPTSSSTAPSNPSPEPKPGEPIAKPTSAFTTSDESFEAWNPGFYRFSEDNFHKVCNTCGMKFNSHLEMTRFCSPDCRDLLLRRLTGIKDEPERTRKR